MILPVLRLLALLAVALGMPLSREITEKKDPAKSEIKKDTLRLITVVARHGERAPETTYTNDPYIKDPMLPYSWGHLTNKGRINQYNQGLFLRERYNDFLGTSYNPDVFYLQSTNVDRTKMSAMLEAASLWKPNKEQLFKPDLPWQPVVLFYQEQSKDTVKYFCKHLSRRPDIVKDICTLMLVWNTCPKYTELRGSVNNLPEVQEVYKNNEALFEELTNFTGMQMKNADDVSSFYATLAAEEGMNLTLPEWTKNYYPDKLIPLTLYSLQFNTYNDVLRRLKGSPMLKKIISDMLAKREGTLQPRERKMFMFIGHDSTIVDLLNTMHIWHNQLPHYNIMTMIELHEDEGGWNVQVFLRNTTAHEPYSLTIPGCTTACPLDKFVEILRPVIPNNWEEECKVDGNFVTPPAPLP